MQTKWLLRLIAQFQVFKMSLPEVNPDVARKLLFVAFPFNILHSNQTQIKV